MTDAIDLEAGASTWGLGGDLPVHRLAFGAMRITGRGIWGEPRDHDETIATLRRAVELGVNLIDTADSYGPFVSERLIAQALHPYPDDLVIATKGGLTRSGRTSGVPTVVRSTSAPPATGACSGCGWSRSRCTSSTGSTRRSRSRTRWACSSAQGRRQDPPHRRLQRE